MEGRFKGSQTRHDFDRPRPIFARRAQKGTRSYWGLEDLLLRPPSFPVTIAQAVLDLVQHEADAIRETLNSKKKKEQKLPKPPELLTRSKIYFQANKIRQPLCKPYHLKGRGPPSTDLVKEYLATMSPHTLAEKSIHVPPLKAKEDTIGGLNEGSFESKIQRKGLKTQGTQSKIRNQLEQYRLNSQARMQLKQRSDSYLLDKHKKHRQKQNL